MREETKKGVGDWRIEIAEKQLVPRFKDTVSESTLKFYTIKNLI